MRLLDEELIAAQKSSEVEDPYIELKLSYNGSTEYFYKTRILPVEHEEQPLNHRATILLNNADGALSEKDYKGWSAVMSYGATVDGETYKSATAPLKVIEHYWNSAPNNLQLSLTCIGIPNLLAEDRAKSTYLPEADDETTLQEYFTAIAGATLDPFTECPAYEVVYDSVDGLIDTYQPKDSFRIYKGQSRLGVLRSIIDFTGCVMRVRNDGKIHVFVPTVSGTDYDSEFAWEATPTEHQFFSKGYAEKIVFPNRIVVSSMPDDDPQFEGEYTYSPSYDKIPSSQYEETYLTSNAQGALMAENIAMKYAMAADGGNVQLPIMCCGTESFDYVKITDERQGDTRVGNVGKLIRRWNPYNPPNEVMTLTVWFGGWLSIRQSMNNLENFPSGFGTKGTYFSRLTVKDLYAENIQAENLDFVWLDPDGNIDLSQIGDTLDSLPDGETYARVKSLHLDAGQIVMDEAIYYSSGYNPSEKRRNFTAEPTPPYDIGDLWIDGTVTKFCIAARTSLESYNAADWTLVPLDAIGDGTTYQRVLSTQITAGKIHLSDELSYAVGYNPSEKRRTFTAEPTTPYDVGDLWLDDTVVKRCTTARASGDYVAGDWTETTLDAIANGTTYKRVASASLTAEGLVLLDQVSTGTYGLVLAADISAGHILMSAVSGDLDDIANGTYGKVLTADISAGHIKLSTVEQSSSYRTTTDTEKGIWNGKPDDMDEIANGSTYQKVRATSISSGNILLNSYTVISGEWYNESGVEIDASHGINIYGTANALTTRATKTGTIQCYVGADGKLYAGAGAVILDSTGCHIYGGFLKIYRPDTSARVGTITGDATGIIIDGIYSPYSQVKILGNIYNTHGWNSDCDPDVTGTYDLGSTTSLRWSKIRGNLVLFTDYYGSTEEGLLCMEGSGGNDLYIYSSGAWRTNA